MPKRTLVRFAMPTTPQIGAAAALELGAIFDGIGLELEPVFVASYDALFDTMHRGGADAAWSPPLVARDLQREGTATPCAAVVRAGSIRYFSAIVGTENLHSPKDIKRFGWVSRLSAAGYLVPRSYLASLGRVDFGDERFFHSHTRTMDALRAGAVDAIATYALRDDASEKPHVPHAFEGAKILATIGPIPGDVIVLASSMAKARAKKITKTLHDTEIDPAGSIAALLGAAGFRPVPESHVESLTKWLEHPVFTATRISQT